MLMSVIKAADSSLFNDKIIIDFFKHFNDLFKKHDIFKKNLKIYQLPHYCNAEHADVVHLFLKYTMKNWKKLCAVIKKKFWEINLKQHHNNWIFLKKLKNADCKNMRIIKKYYQQFNTIFNKLIIKTTLNLFIQFLWFFYDFPEDLHY